MSHYQTLVQRAREDAEFRAALERATTSEARIAVVRAAGLEPPTADDILTGVAGGYDQTLWACDAVMSASCDP
jgi:hypothetical protein